MPRPQRRRRIGQMPRVGGFCPECHHALHRQKREVVVMLVEEYEAIRLIDFEGMNQEQCAEQMQVARTTVQQIYTTARKKIAKALVEGCALKIEGGCYELCSGECDCNCACCRRRDE